MTDIFFFEAFEEEAEALQRHLGGRLKAVFTPAAIQESGIDEPPARIVSIRTQSVIPPAWATRVGALLTRSTGYDHVRDYRARHRADLPCGYLPLYCNRAVAEQALLLWMALLRRLPRQALQFERFHRDGLTGRECAGKTLAVFGVGNIGSEICAIGEGLGMRVLGVDPVRRFEGRVRYVSPEEALAEADIIACAMNLTPENRGYFDYRRLREGRPGRLFVNIARGELSPASDLLRLMEEQRLGGLGLDVYNHESELAVALRSGRASTDEEVAALHALRKLDNVICTPHNAFNTIESVDRKSEQSIRQAEHFVEHGSFLWTVPDN